VGGHSASVRLAPAARCTLAERDRPIPIEALIDVQERLEGVLERDVDVVNARFAHPGVTRQAQAEGVVLHGRA